MPRVYGAGHVVKQFMLEDNKQFGVMLHIEKKAHPPFQHAVLQTTDGLTHYIHIIDRTNKMLRYVLGHDQRAYLVMLSMVQVLFDTPVTCLTCLSKGPAKE